MVFMVKDKKEIAKLIYDELKKEDIKSTLFLISKELEEEKTEKLQFTKTPFLNSIGQELGKLLLEGDWKLERLGELWREGGRDERLIVISALGKISKKEYESSKKFTLSILNDILDWEICDQLALKVIVNLVLQNQKEMFSLMEQWITSENKWVRRLGVATIPPYIRVRRTDSKVCLEFLDKMMREGDKDVKKAMGWALREITKNDSKPVFTFLQKWTNVEDKNTKWIIKEGMKNLSKQEQNKLNYLIGG